MDTRHSAALGVAMLGGLATVTSLGENVTVPDVLISAGACWGITYAISTVILKTRSSNSINSKESQQRSVLQSSDHIDLGEMSTEIQTFLSSLKLEPSGKDGWYRDPSSLFMLRYFHAGKWTRAVSDFDTEIERTAALSKFLPHLHEPLEPSDRPLTTFGAEQTGIPKEELPIDVDLSVISQRLEQLERLGKLREHQTISEQEFQILKKQII